MTIPKRFGITPSTGLLLTLLLCAAAYWPGLRGGYLFDDYPNIVDNKDLQIESISVPNLARAALASPSSELKRPLASLSFAANFLQTGLDPFWMKLTNLVLHLLNGVLIYVLSIALIRTAHQKAPAPIDMANAPWVALCITAAWLLLPINLTAVLYVVQRMESLANLFVLLGLWAYVRARLSMLNSGTGFSLAAGALVLATAAGLLSKETAVMTPLYALLIEWALFRAQSSGRARDYRILILFLVILAIPLALGLSWQLPKVLKAGAWATRNFDLHDRLLTEARVVADYIQWILLPTPKALSFYHDSYAISTGWLTPWSTLFCALFLAGLAAFAVAVRKRVPLIALGIALFLSAQLLTATILPLELVYEHRNYFASFGLLLALIPLLLAGTEKLPAAGARRLLLGGLMLLWGASTISTAMAWGSPLTLAQTLAKRAPDSPRALYGLGYTYIVQSDYNPDSPFTTAAYAPLEKAMRLPEASILPEQALIMMNGRMQQPIKDEWWDSLIGKLKARKATVQDEGSLEALSKCVEQKKCALNGDKMLSAFLASLSHPHPSARLLAIYGGYAWNAMSDHALGQAMLSEAVKTAPREPAYRITLAKMLIVQGNNQEADQQIAVLQSLNTGGRFNIALQELSKLQSRSPRT